ncbi:type III secretion system cytoplasmic ring protein SctQ [Luteimonas sp. 100069]|uniref:type III secretion system cytoplasmic ring protein SctQ n=1 Tax=Luteimonas sp. 100069 TaxID=2006109 RepID=UPI000F4FC41C|nr:type III secretion system cytoplasmic ring protein SctQ [Luteimonas sp. 100069]RPD85437.1 YscQ/HrcQ family type III secretion apparatus protein [Luteimonas sp. 100069]
MADAMTGRAGPTPLRERLPRLSPVQADTLRQLHGRPRQWVTPAGTLRLRAGRAPRPDGTDAGVFELDADGTRLGLRLASPPAADGDALHWQDRDGRARVLAWSLAHEATLVQISDALGTSLLPLPDAPPPPAADVVWMDLDIASPDGAAAVHGSLRAPATWLQDLLSRADAGPRAPVDPGAWRQLPVIATVAIPAPPLTVADVRSLRPGDVVVVGHVRLPPLHAHAAGLRWPVRAGPDGWRIDGPAAPHPRFQEMPRMSETDATDTPTPDEAPAAEDPTGRLPVEIEFEVGKLELRLSDIAALQPGYVFALPAHLEGANVTIRVNGQVTGQGELVAVGDTLGVRLLSWS